MYATIDDFIKAFGEEETLQLSALDNPSITQIQDDVIQRALDDAAAEINSYLRAAGYALPLSYLPDNLRERANDIARYRLDKNRQRSDVRLRYEDALQFLKDLVDRKASLSDGTDLCGNPGTGTGTGGTNANSGSPDGIRYYSNPRVFTACSLRRY